VTNPRLGSLVLTLFLIGLGPMVGEAGLPPAPIQIRVSPSTLQEGERAVIRVKALPDRSTPLAMRTGLDLYVIRIPGGPPVAHFLTATGEWSRTPIAYRQAVTLSSLPIATEWREAGPAGWATVIVLAVHTSKNPSRREHWAYQPIVRQVRVRAAGPIGCLECVELLLPIGGIALLASVIVLFDWKQTRAIPQTDKS